MRALDDEAAPFVVHVNGTSPINTIPHHLLSARSLVARRETEDKFLD